MGMNRQTGNMYAFVSHTWNPIRGKCPHECIYCYMKKMKIGNLRLEEKELQTDLGDGNFIFVGSSTDMFAERVNEDWIVKVLEHCRAYPGNTYLFQTKNPSRFYDFLDDFPKSTILGTTIETNRRYNISHAIQPSDRAFWMSHISRTTSFITMVSVEPVMDFDVSGMVAMLQGINPRFISIGADSKGHCLPEPSPEKIKVLIGELKGFTDVRVKDNLGRLMRA